MEGRGGRVDAGFVHALTLPGWSGRWGYDALLECYWAELWPPDGAGRLLISSEHLVPTMSGLARAVSARAGVPHVDAYLAMTA
jgi:hypothetical protein